MKILILGANGFIGHAISRRILEDTDWQVYAMDLADDRLAAYRNHPRFRFLEGDITIMREWIDYHIKVCDVLLPLVAIATPKSYIERPLEVFQLDFEENLRLIRQAAKHKTRVVFPSTSEVYGMCQDSLFNEETSPLVMGPISKQRWIYACSKQLLDRVIWAMGQHENLDFSLFRPFNWIGANLDNIDDPKEGSSRVVTQFLGNMLRGEPVRLVDGGQQRRSFTYLEDGIDALFRIIKNEKNAASGRIFNVGNPKNDCSIRDLAEMMIDILGEFKGYEALAAKAQLVEVSSSQYYGKAYQDMATRVPDIQTAREHLQWEPLVGLREALKRTIGHYVATREPYAIVQRVCA